MEELFHLDKLDRQILSMISKDARVPFLEIARKCNVSGAAIHQRIHRLNRMGVLTGSKFTINPKKVGLRTCAYMGIFLDKASLYKDVLGELQKIPEITQCHYTTGNYSVFIKIYTRDNEHLKTILTEKIQSIPGISRTETFISLEEGFNRSIPIPAVDLNE